MKRLLLLALALILICGGAFALLAKRTVPFGPLGAPPPNEHASACTPAKDGRAYDGQYALRNPGKDAVTIDEVRLVEPERLTIVGAYLAPIYGTLIGNVPPEDSPYPDSVRAWRDRVRAAGATLPPGDERNLVLLLQIGEETGRAKLTEVRYHDTAGKRFRFLTTVDITVVPPTQHC